MTNRIRIIILCLIFALLGGSLGWLIAYKQVKAPTHYHANWALYINGQRVDFSAVKYMESVQTCTVGKKVLPQQRVHLHDGNQDVIHVHADGVTWGAFLANLGYSAGTTYLITDLDQVYANNERAKITYILNGKTVDNPMNDVIKTTDRLLISYGNESADQLINERFPKVATSAAKFNSEQDPASCSGSGN